MDEEDKRGLGDRVTVGGAGGGLTRDRGTRHSARITRGCAGYIAAVRTYILEQIGRRSNHPCAIATYRAPRRSPVAIADLLQSGMLAFPSLIRNCKPQGGLRCASSAVWARD